jgi:hypothetical protein
MISRSSVRRCWKDEKEASPIRQPLPFAPPLTGASAFKNYAPSITKVPIEPPR